MNKGEHPDVFMNQGSIAEPNQDYFKMDYFQELVKEQKRLNESLLTSYRNLNFGFNEQKITQARRWQDIGNELAALKETNLQHEKFESNAMEWLTMLDENSEKMKEMLEQEGLLKQEVIDQINHVSKSNQDIVHQLGKYETTNQQLTIQLEELFDLHKQMSDKFSKHDENQNQVLNQLENQEAMMEKTFRQINNIRSILFERASFLAEKIEDSYQLTSSAVYKLLTGSEQPLTLYMQNKKEQKNSN
ncbi:hypothetical protein [Virgibacillus ndiopensis]|uniref:hypothetical protein n=1 Tax=Virgibacillus ndiopensis TaxID=2004408 RepID=UPI0011457C1D|nr:hypothetical protein [Virgibacillus ndiopensis]